LSHPDFLLCKHNCISYTWQEICGRGRQVKTSCTMGHCMEKVDSHCSRTTA